MRPLLFTVLLIFQFTISASINAGERQVRILALGDSLTAGYGLGPGEGLVDVLQDKLREAGLQDELAIEVINAGVSGDTTRGGLARLDWALADKPDVAMVALGGNDMLRGLEPSESYQNLRAILTGLEEAGVPVLLAGMLAPANMGADYQAEFDAIYPQLAREYDVIFYPFFLEGVALDAELNQNDGLHPNRAGVEVMVDRLLPYISQLVEKESVK